MQLKTRRSLLATLKARVHRLSKTSQPFSVASFHISCQQRRRRCGFYVRAFGAREVFRYPPDEQGRTMHIHLHVNGGSLMLSARFRSTAAG